MSESATPKEWKTVKLRRVSIEHHQPPLEHSGLLLDNFGKFKLRVTPNKPVDYANNEKEEGTTNERPPTTEANLRQNNQLAADKFSDIRSQLRKVPQKN